MSKICKNCKNEINSDAKYCPICKKKQGGLPKWAIVLIVIFAIIVLAMAFGDDTDDSSSSENNSTNNSINNQSNQTPENIEYEKVAKDDLDDVLDNNAAAAKDTYVNKYVEITGRLGTIDSDLKYISLDSPTDDYDLRGIHCRIKNQSQKDVVKTLSSNQEITVKGKITDVGEILGYSLDITEIYAN